MVFHGFSLFQVGLSWFLVGFSWFFSKCTCPNCILARRSNLGPPPEGRHRTECWGKRKELVLCQEDLQNQPTQCQVYAKRRRDKKSEWKISHRGRAIMFSHKWRWRVGGLRTPHAWWVQALKTSLLLLYISVYICLYSFLTYQYTSVLNIYISVLVALNSFCR